MTPFNHTRHVTTRYKLEQFRIPFSFLLTRLSDGATAYFQGDDADLWERNMEAIEDIKQWNVGNSLDGSFDHMCSGYDDILTAVVTPQ